MNAWGFGTIQYILSQREPTHIRMSGTDGLRRKLFKQSHTSPKFEFRAHKRMPIRAFFEFIVVDGPHREVIDRTIHSMEFHFWSIKFQNVSKTYELKTSNKRDGAVSEEESTFCCQTT